MDARTQAKALEVEGLLRLLDGELTETQALYMSTWLSAARSGTKFPMTAACEQLGATRAAINNAIKGAKVKAARHHGYDPDRPHVDPPMPGMQLKRLTEFKKGGKVSHHYQIYTAEERDIEVVCEQIVDGLAADMPRLKVPKPAKHLSADIMNAAYFGDPHINMYAWGTETLGQDWDVDIAIDTHMDAMVDLIYRAPRAKTGVLATLGDMFHSDGREGVTPKSGHIVDQDTRWDLAVDRTTDLIRRMILAYLQVVEHLYVVIVPGNHSPILERMLSKCLAIAFEKTKRVTVVPNTSFHIPLPWERNFILFTHGDGLSPQRKADIATGHFRDLHGAADFTHVVTGHLHHSRVDQIGGCKVEIFEVLPPADAWHCKNGYLTSDQSASILTYHKHGGIVTRNTYYPRIALRNKK